jgi:hypothetical protein
MQFYVMFSAYSRSTWSSCWAELLVLIYSLWFEIPLSENKELFIYSLLYCSNSCTSLHFKTLKYQLKHLKFAHTCFGLLWNHPQRVHGRTSLRYWIVMFIYIRYKVSVCGCMSVHSVCVSVWVPIWSSYSFTISFHTLNLWALISYV